MTHRFLTALPVFNEVQHVESVLNEVKKYSQDVLVIDDGSSDGTAEVLAARRDIEVERHAQNRGYGAALRTAFRYAAQRGYETLVTIDCDGQHEPQRIPRFVTACEKTDIVSGSRYLMQYADDDEPPADRQWVNQMITADLNRRLGLRLTDAFCGFKAYRVAALDRLRLSEDGYAMPLELWVQAVAAGLKVIELPVPLIYLDEERSFGENLDDTLTRLQYYQDVVERALDATGMEVAAKKPGLCGKGAR